MQIYIIYTLHRSILQDILFICVIFEKFWCNILLLCCKSLFLLVRWRGERGIFFMAEKNETGKKGEEVACSYLTICGYQILHTNWRFHRYELDIVATNDKELIVVEVKTRSKNHLLYPEDAIDHRKIQHITTAADAYVRKFGIDMPVRFDVLCLIKDGLTYTVEKHYEDAFYAIMKTVKP